MGERQIAVYADWEGLDEPLFLGDLRAHPSGGKEVFSFEFAAAALAHPDVRDLALDPRLGIFEGRQFAPDTPGNFGVFLDSAPDRWGRMLMQRRLERARRRGEVPANTRLAESDYLLGVHDLYRAGALRFKLSPGGDFLDDAHGTAAPPMVRLRALEQATRALETSADTAADIDDWLRMLIAPGGSLGGARPKASVVDEAGHLWIAKFPSVKDDHDVGAWELLVHALARRCGITVAPARAQRFYSREHTFLVERFDRAASGSRLHFASAMTLTGRADGADAAAGASYLELARVLIEHGVQPKEDLGQLWRRIVFNMCVSNTDDHLRNHGFILVPRKGWLLSPAFDMNPVSEGDGLRLNVSEADNAQDLGLALSVAPIFRVTQKAARAIVDETRRFVAQWPTLAAHLRISAAEREGMARAFRLSE